MKLYKITKLFTLVIISLIIVFMSVLIYKKTNVFSFKEPKIDRFIFLFERYTQIQFPKSGEIVKKKNNYGINDGIEAAIIKVKDSSEFFKLKNDIIGRTFMISKKWEPGIGYFSSDIFFNEGLIDTVVSSNKDLLVIAFTKDGYKIIFEKTW
ncbi:MAG: hypothetical protein NWQ17_03995 [Polaribacter sp.]|nr:hypothetical protein [Polaribacter sp.]